MKKKRLLIYISLCVPFDHLSSWSYYPLPDFPIHQPSFSFPSDLFTIPNCTLHLALPFHPPSSNVFLCSSSYMWLYIRNPFGSFFLRSPPWYRGDFQLDFCSAFNHMVFVIEAASLYRYVQLFVDPLRIHGSNPSSEHQAGDLCFENCSIFIIFIASPNATLEQNKPSRDRL